MKFTLSTLIAATTAVAAQIAGAAEPQTAAPQPFQPVPNAAQLRWHKAEYIMMACFGMKTFHPSGNHMGDGKEDPKTFNPVKFDAGQWVEAAKAGGFKGIVLTTKHHEGFAIWQSETTDFGVKGAAWQDGKGDVVKDLGVACSKAGIYFGLYASILDMNYENNKTTKFARYATYGDFYFDQLKELSTKYGPVDEYWFDGYNANGLKIDYARIAKMIKENQPNAVIYDSGMLVKHLPDRCIAWPGAHGGVRPEQEYRRKIDNDIRWYPNEPSIIFQGNWYHCGRPAISARQMQDCYLTSTGHGVTPLMNVPPNADGLIDEDTVTKLKEFKAWVDKLNQDNLAQAPGTKVSDSGHRGKSAQYAADKAVDSDYDTYFATDDGTTDATIEIAFDKPKKIGGFILQEYIPLGQRVDGYSIECRVDGKWTEVFAGKKIGYKRIILEGRSAAPALSFNEGNIDVLKIKTEGKAQPGTGKLTLPVADAVRLKIISAQACPLINNFQVVGEGH